jgi:hypothetical protein
MEQPLLTKVPTPAAPRFYLTDRQQLSPAAILLAIVAASLVLVLHALQHTGHMSLTSDRAGIPRSANSTSKALNAGDTDEPFQIEAHGAW